MSNLQRPDEKQPKPKRGRRKRRRTAIVLSIIMIILLILQLLAGLVRVRPGSSSRIEDPVTAIADRAVSERVRPSSMLQTRLSSLGANYPESVSYSAGAYGSLALAVQATDRIVSRYLNSRPIQMLVLPI
jgi:hypothetical protein